MAKDFNSKLYLKRVKCFMEAVNLLNNVHQEDALEVAKFEQTENVCTSETTYEVDVYNKKYAVRFYLLEDDFNLEPGHFVDFENNLVDKFKDKELVIARILTFISKIINVCKKLCDPYTYGYVNTGYPNSVDKLFYNRVRLASDKGPNTVWLG